MTRGSGFARKQRERPILAFPAPIRRVAPTVICQAVRAKPKEPRHADRHLLDMARGQACLLQSPICNRDPETTVACHGAGVANGKGLGIKVGDQLSCWGCSACNHFTDAYGVATAAEKAEVFEAGMRRQIQAWQAIAADTAAAARDRSSAESALAKLLLSNPELMTHAV